MSDGRWRVIGSQLRFTEPDEQKAIARFHELTDDRGAAIERTVYSEVERMWDYVGQQIRTRPQWVAQRLGIEQIGYLTTLRPPVRLPSFSELEATWKTHFIKSIEQKRKVIAAWSDFKRIAKVSGLRDIQTEAVVKYRDVVYCRGISGKSQQNLFSRIRRLISFNKSRGVAVEELTRCLTVLSLLAPDDTTVSLDPKPISKEEWHQLLSVATGDDRAMLLIMINCGMYVAEVVRLRWSEIKDGCLVANRRKTGRCLRVAKLWPETMEAIKCVQKLSEFVFIAYHGGQLSSKGGELRFRNLRDKAGVQVTSSQLRDGAATAMAVANTNNDLCSLVLGHRTGIKDHYVRRNPGMVKAACEAIRLAYH